MKDFIQNSILSFRTNDFLKEQVNRYARATHKSDSSFIRDAVLEKIRLLRTQETNPNQDIRFF